MLKNTLIEIFGYILITVALLFYFGWALYYNAWTDVGLISFVAPIFLFGILGVILARTGEKQGQ